MTISINTEPILLKVDKDGAVRVGNTRLLERRVPTEN